jgi:hypothetical protein
MSEAIAGPAIRIAPMIAVAANFIASSPARD